MASWKRKELYGWEPETGDVSIYDQFPESFQAEGLLFANACRIGKNIIYFPLAGSQILSLDSETKEIKGEQQVCDRGEEPIATYFVKQDGRQIYVNMVGYDGIRSVEYAEGKLCLKPYCAFDSAYNSGAISNYFLESGYYHLINEKGTALDDFLKILENAE